MDHEEHVLNLSHAPPSPSVSFASILSSLQPTYQSTSHPPHHLTSPEFSVEELERHIANLLNQNASAALINAAAAQHRPTSIDSLTSSLTSNDSMAQLNINLSGLAAVLHAAQAQAEETQRAASELVAEQHPPSILSPLAIIQTLTHPVVSVVAVNPRAGPKALTILSLMETLQAISRMVLVRQAAIPSRHHLPYNLPRLVVRLMVRYHQYQANFLTSTTFYPT